MLLNAFKLLLVYTTKVYMIIFYIFKNYKIFFKIYLTTINNIYLKIYSNFLQKRWISLLLIDFVLLWGIKLLRIFKYLY